MNEDQNNHQNQQEENNETFDIHQAQQMANDYARNIHQQLLQYRGMLKQLSGQSKLTNNSKSAEKAKIKKAIATLQNMLTNPQLIQKRVTQSLQQQQMINEYVKQLEAEQAAEKSSNSQENIEKNTEKTIDTSEKNSDNK